MNIKSRAGGNINEWDNNLPYNSSQFKNMNDLKFEILGLRDTNHMALTTLYL